MVTARTLSPPQPGLRILTAVHGPVSWSVRQLTARNMPFPHIIDVLAAAGVLQDHRPAAIDVEPPHEPRALHRRFQTAVRTIWMPLRSDELYAIS